MDAQLPNPRTRRIFVSYGHDEHSDVARQIREDLVARGHKVWFDAREIKPGADWERHIEEGLNWAARDKDGRMVLIMTPHAVRRPDGYCLNEVTKALNDNLLIVPVMLVWCEPPLSLYRVQWLDMQDCLPLDQRPGQYQLKFQRLIEALEGDTIDFEGFQSLLINALKPLAFEVELRRNLDRFTGRDWVFAAIDRWLADGDACRIFWITGGPGTGKTAIAAWLCTHRPEIVAFHFCRYDNVQKRDARRAITSIAYQLSTQLPDYEERLRRVGLEGIDGLDARTLFDHLIAQPLAANYPDPGRPVVVLIDALDEATVGGRNELAGFLASEFEKTPPWMRLILSSRPVPEVMAALQAYSPFQLGIADPRNERDIAAFLG
ncbi:MAG TPA: toll/interleukin-1 receptor domain-containing protein, partial [Methanocella sp.]|nr:toll/interleukin-1 receptor domain-containing protein [Methanocella sp.]